jgi:hypothetical protein
MEKIKIKFWLASMTTLTVLFMKILPVTLFKLLVAAYGKPPDSENSFVSRR